ncbi:MAG: hypothetical protein J2P37_02860 [Ktedonobacteraceae bacterium]|nr:hypothetical protein [Ktedonobacteraceae bacterium]
MNNTVAILARIAALAGGALLGALLSRWVDNQMSMRFQEQSEYDRNRYAQGLSPVSQSQAGVSRIHTVDSVGYGDEPPYRDEE